MSYKSVKILIGYKNRIIVKESRPCVDQENFSRGGGVRGKFLVIFYVNLGNLNFPGVGFCFELDYLIFFHCRKQHTIYIVAYDHVCVDTI